MIPGFLYTLQFKVLYMYSTNTSMEALQDIHRMMERSSRFISLSGLSGIGAGIVSLAGAWVAWMRIREYQLSTQQENSVPGEEFEGLVGDLLLLAVGVFLAALVSSVFFTYRKSGNGKNWKLDTASKKLLVNLFIPVFSGAIFIVAMLARGTWEYAVGASLIFYGLALVNASKYTISDIRSLGLVQLLIGFGALFFPDLGLYFWASGFGLLHVLYGAVMWYRYDRFPQGEEEKK